MSYSEDLAQRIRQYFATYKHVEEKKMMGGLTFMYNGKMCVGIIKNELMCRIDPAMHDTAIQKKGCRTMDFTKRPMSGYVIISADGIKAKKDFDYWMQLAIDYNPKAKSSKKK